MKHLLKSTFPQFVLVNPRQFCQEAEKRRIRIRESDLEYLDKLDIIRPCLRFRSSILDSELTTILPKNPYDWCRLYKQNCIELPKPGDFIPWKKRANKEKREQIGIYYHPWQLLFLKEQLSDATTQISTEDLIKTKVDVQVYIKTIKTMHKKCLQATRINAKKYHNKIIGLLMLLEEPYSATIRGYVYLDRRDKNSHTKWNNWQKTKEFSKAIHKKSGFTEKGLIDIYEKLVFNTNNLDPINAWNPFMELIKRNKKRKLKGDALLAEDFFEALKMMALHIKDLTGKQMPEPGNSAPWLGNEWKEIAYGKPFNINSKKTVNRILSDYIYSRPIIASIIVEGKTEEKVIRKIMKQVNIDKPEKQGIHIYNLRGSGNLKQKNIDGYITRARLDENEIYVIADKDAEKFLKDHKGNTVKEDNITIWDTDFEGDNFEICEIMTHINKLLKEQKFNPLSLNQVKQAYEGKKLISAFHDVIYKETGQKLESDIISKVELSLLIMKSRFPKIRKEYHEKGWKPKYPIERVIKKILKTIPKYVD